MARIKKENENQTSDLVGQLDDMNALLESLLAVNVANLKTTQSEKISILYRAGLSVSTIADVLGTSPNTVAVALHSIRKRNQSGSHGKKSKATSIR